MLIIYRKIIRDNSRLAPRLKPRQEPGKRAG